MDKNKSQKDESQNSSPDIEPNQLGEEEPTFDESIGAILRGERQKRGLNYEQLSEVTRLRPFILEALENEAWDSLPSRVFARGFIRSYARALGLEEVKILTFFDKVSPIGIPSPKLLIEPAKSKKPIFIILIFLILALLSFYYLWKGYSINKSVSSRTKNIIQVENKLKKPKKIQHISNNVRPSVTKKEDQTNMASDAENAINDMELNGNSLDENKKQYNEIILEPFHGDIEASEMTLEANIREKTWIRIILDDQDSKEYVFQPGTHVEWKAKKGIEMLIGNAGGIDLKFNGDKVKRFGSSGQVVRLRFPEDYKRRN